MKPLTPANCDLRHFPRAMIDVVRLRNSDFDATNNDALWRAGMNMWFSAWHQVPAGSIMNDEEALTKAAGFGRDVRSWRRLSGLALRSWVLCTDGRFYHPVTCEIALESWLITLSNRGKTAAGRAKIEKVEFDPSPVYWEIRIAADHLAALNPKSDALTKEPVRRALKWDFKGYRGGSVTESVTDPVTEAVTTPVTDPKGIEGKDKSPIQGKLDSLKSTTLRVVGGREGEP